MQNEKSDQGIQMGQVSSDIEQQVKGDSTITNMAKCVVAADGIMVGFRHQASKGYDESKIIKGKRKRKR